MLTQRNGRSSNAPPPPPHQLKRPKEAGRSKSARSEPHPSVHRQGAAQQGAP